MRSIAVAAIAAALTLGGTAQAQTPPYTLTVKPTCQTYHDGSFHYGYEWHITGLGPWGPGVGYAKTPDFEIGPTGFSGDADGVYDTGFDSLIPGWFVLKIYEPFVATRRLYVDCGRPLPVKRWQCKHGDWRRVWGFDSKRACFKWGRLARQCSADSRTGQGTINPCPPALPKKP